MTLEFNLSDDDQTKEEKISLFTTNAQADDDKLTAAIKASVRHMEKSGIDLFSLRTSLSKESDRVSKKNKNLKKFLKENLPHITISEAKKRIKFAKKLHLGEHPNLAFLGLSRIQNLMDLSDRKSIPKILMINGIDLKINSRSKASVKSFTEATDQLIANLKEERVDEIEE